MQITVRVKPGSQKGPLVEEGEDELTVYVRERAVDGAANDGVRKVLAKHFGVAPSRVSVVRGHTSRIKRIEIDD